VNQRLLPIFRSDEQAAVLTVLFVLHAGAMSLTELADRAGVSVAHAHKEIERLEPAGLVHSERVGRNRMVRANPDSPYAEDLRRLLTKALGPPVVLRRALADLPGVDRAFVYGSWAEAASGGELAGPPADIDLMIIGKPDIGRVYEIARAVENELGLPVNPTVLESDEWEAADSGFLRSVRSKPTIELVP